MSDYLQPGTTMRDVDEAIQDPEPPDNTELCRHCNDYPCRCLMDDDPFDVLPPEGWEEESYDV